MNTIDTILEFAITNENNAQKFYLKLAAKSSSKHMRNVFNEFAAEEVKHRLILERVKNGDRDLLFSPEVVNLNIAEHLSSVDIDSKEEFDFPQALLMAMKAEQEAFDLYTKLAELAEDPEIRVIFEGLANEESGHKLRFETEYDESILKEN
jgi:rubrerythrin